MTSIKQSGHDYDSRPPKAASERFTGGRRIGPHLPLRPGLLKAAERAKQIGATAVQFFADNPTSWRRRAELPAELEDFRARLAEYDIWPLAIHAPYLINLCGERGDFWDHSCRTLANELVVAARYGARFVVVHIGSHRGHGREHGIRRLAEGMRRVLDEAEDDVPAPLLVLENAPGSGDGVGSTIEDLADIDDVAAAAGVDRARTAFCLDTAHLWSAGYEIDKPDEIDALVGRIDALLGRERVVMLHLNDARTSRGSHLDRHEHIGAGQIGRSGLRHLLTEPWLSTLPAYLETPGMDVGYDAINLDRVRLLLADQPLPDLPPEAFTAHGSRSRAAAPPADSR